MSFRMWCDLSLLTLFVGPSNTVHLDLGPCATQLCRLPHHSVVPKNGTRISIELHRLGGEYTVKNAVIEPNDGQYTSYLPLFCDYAPKRRGHSQVQFFCFQINSTPIIELQELTADPKVWSGSPSVYGFW